jgi:hypothetical protein
MLSEVIPLGAPRFKRFWPHPYDAIRQCLPYIDTLHLFFRDWLPLGVVERVRAVNGAGKVWAEPRFTYGWMLIIQQPTYETLLLLGELQRQYRATLSRLDVAFDFICRDADRLALAQWLAQHLLLKWRRAGLMHEEGSYEEETIYWSYKARRRDLCLYADRTSKLTGESCIHLELRLLKPTRRLRSIKQLTTLNPKEMLQHHVRLVTFDWGTFTKKLVKKEMRRSSYRRETEVNLNPKKYPHIALFRKQYFATREDRVTSWLMHVTQGNRLQRLRDGWPKERLDSVSLEVLKVGEELQFAADGYLFR